MCLSSFPPLAQDKPEGILISSERINYSDGTSSVENIYTQSQNPLNSSLFAMPSKLLDSTYGSDTFTKTKSWYSGLNGNGSLIVSAQLIFTTAINTINISLLRNNSEPLFCNRPINFTNIMSHNGEDGLREYLRNHKDLTSFRNTPFLFQHMNEQSAS